LAALQGLQGVERITDFGRAQELRIARDRDPQEIVRAIIARTRVESFEIARPSLHDIFVRIAGPEAREADDA